ncbi:uncharacterized protein K02A2.6-like [Malaya genurostris]|uniref:uncharacterized protein K02A2.6-like n=1 Tax=Malaya genurostris TaxID=325434 RepID=UPI0026F4058A|nr:uncharacterized protein K02A2.6-like [Malaya genurostris]
MMDTHFQLDFFNDTVDSSNLRCEWEEWHRACEIVVELKNIESQHQKLLFMLARGGRGLQRIYHNLAPVVGEIYPGPVKIPFAPEEVPEYDNAVKRLNSFFVGKRNERVELEIFRSIRQAAGESFNRFVLRLRTQAACCDFLDRVEKELLQQITVGAIDERVRDKGLEGTMSLDEIINYAINREILLNQKQKAQPFRSESDVVSLVKQDWMKKTMPKDGHSYQRFNRVRKQEYGNRPSTECSRCGSWRHQQESKDCIARNATCNKCGAVGHFARKCSDKRYASMKNRFTWKKTEAVNTLRNEVDFNREARCSGRHEEITPMKVNPNDGTIVGFIDKLPVKFLIDSGATINTVTNLVWEKLIASNARIFKKKFKCDRQFIAYASEEPLRVIAIFEAWITINETKPKNYAELFVIQGAQKCLLSKRTAEDLKILKVGLEVQTITQKKVEFPKFPNVQVKLSIDYTVPPRKLAYLRIPVALENKVSQKLQEMLDADIIEPVFGPSDWISPMVVVPKGAHDIRLCIDMRYPNRAIQREHYPLPLVDTLLCKLKGAVIFSKLDITSAYYHVELHPDSREITTFITANGLMRFKRLMFGVNCAPEIFQRIMCEMLAGIDGVMVYIDDVIVWGANLIEHNERLQKVLKVLDENHALLNKTKCLFEVHELEILGFKISGKGISPTDDKISAIQNFRIPETKEEVRSFLGLVNFVGHFIPHLSTRIEVLRRFIRGEVQSFGLDQQQAFDDLRNELCNTVRRLGFFDPKDQTELYVDASAVGLGAVLIQRDSSNNPRIISFASKGLTKTERVYPQTQREALAVVWAVEKFYLYLFGIHFTLFTDHKTLEYIFGGKHQEGKRACSRAEAWALRLQPYDFTVEYVRGIENISDIFSRLCSQSDAPFDEFSEHFVCGIGEGPSAITLSDIKNETKLDDTLKEVVKSIETHIWPSDLFNYQAFSKELGVIDGVVVRNDRIILPSKLRQRALNIAHRGHPGVVSMKRNLRERVWWPYMDRDVENRVQECAGCASVSLQGPPEPMIRKEMPERAWQDLALDFFSAKECATFLVVVDYYSRFLIVTEMKLTNASKTVEALEHIFREHTYPETIRTDNGPPFASEEFSNYCVHKNIRLIRTIPYWPQMNGLVERQNQGILRALRIARSMKEDWRKAVNEYVYSYNTTPHSVTGKSPMELLTGRPVKDLLPSLRTEPYWKRDEETRDKDSIKKMQGKLYADKRRHARESEIAVGDTVMIKCYETGKLEPSFHSEKYTVIQKNGNDVVVLNEDGVKYRRPVAHLKKWNTTRDQNDLLQSPSKTYDELRLTETRQMNENPNMEKSTVKRPKRSIKMPARYYE